MVTRQFRHVYELLYIVRKTFFLLKKPLLFKALYHLHYIPLTLY